MFFVCIFNTNYLLHFTKAWICIFIIAVNLHNPTYNNVQYVGTLFRYHFLFYNLQNKSCWNSNVPSWKPLYISREWFVEKFPLENPWIHQMKASNSCTVCASKDKPPQPKWNKCAISSYSRSQNNSLIFFS